MQEIWKPVKDREQYYQVSNTGKVRSLVGRYKTKPVFELKQHTDKLGYKSLDLSLPSLKKELVHRLVAEVFCNKPDGCDVVNHIDNNPSNNHYNNLEWTTTSGNLVHAQKQGRLFAAQSKGGINNARKATDRVMKETEAMVGKTFGKLKVLSLGEILKYGSANRPRLICECSCGDVNSYCKIRLEKGSSVSCKLCAGKEHGFKIRQEKIDSLKGIVVGTLQFTGNTNNSPQLSLEEVTVELLNLATGDFVQLNYKRATSRRFLTT